MLGDNKLVFKEGELILQEECGFRGNLLQPKDPEVTFFFFGYGEGGGASGLSGVIGCPAGVLARVFRESIDYDEHGTVRHLIEMKHHVLGGHDWLPVVEPAYLGLRQAGHTCMKAGHLPMWHSAACEWLDENWLLADGRFLYTGEAGGDMPLRLSRTVRCLFLP